MLQQSGYNEDAVHDSRVAIRRLREPLALIRAAHANDHLEVLDGRLDKAFKGLGQVRDADIAQQLVKHIEGRFSLAPTVIAHLRATISRDQADGRRRLIKLLESTDAASLGESFKAARHGEWSWFWARTHWREQLARHVHDRVSDVVRALEHGGGVYFPNRSHRARVAIKRLRYALELAGALGVETGANDPGALRKAQNALGKAHDRDVLLQRIDTLAEDEDAMPKREVTLTEQFLTAEIDEQHRKYVRLRPDILELCSALHRPPRRLPVRAGAVGLVALAVGAAMQVAKARPERTSAPAAHR